MICKAKGIECDHVEIRVVKKEGSGRGKSDVERQYCKLEQRITTSRIKCPMCSQVEHKKIEIKKAKRSGGEDLSYLVDRSIELSRELKQTKEQLKSVRLQRDYLYSERKRANKRIRELEEDLARERAKAVRGNKPAEKAISASA